MRIIRIALTALLFTTSTLAAIQTKTIEYKVGDTVLEGYLAWDDAQDVQKPGVIVIHEWWGNNDYSRKRARDLAALGYVGFAIDMYGKGKTSNDPKQAGAWATEIRQNPQKTQALLQAALDTLKAQPQVDPERIAAIGYCFGGAMVLNMARFGMDVDGVVSFHGDLSPPPGHKEQPIKARILVAHGGDDTFVPPQQVEQFKQEMTHAGADFQIKTYPGAEHSFTNPDADKHKLDGVKYSAEADKKSWQDMVMFLGKVFGPKQHGAAIPPPAANLPDVGEYRMEGKLDRQGVYSITARRITLMQAYISAGGKFPEAGQQMFILFTRPENNDQKIAARLLVTDLLSGREKDISLAPGDSILVED